MAAKSVVVAALAGVSADGRYHLGFGAAILDGHGDVSDHIASERDSGPSGLTMRPTRRELVLASFAMLAIPLLTEVAFRFAQVSFDPQLYVGCVERGWTLRPGASGFVNSENRQYVRINSRGFHDRERQYSKSANTLRIAVLGNSWTEALQVPLEQNFTAFLEQDLNQSDCFAGRRVEVLNFGVAGYSTGQELLILQQEVWKYGPDIVIVAFYAARDIANNTRELNNAANPEQSPYFIDANGKLKLDDSFRSLPVLQETELFSQELRYGASQHSRVLQAVGALQRNVRLRMASSEVRSRAAALGVDDLEYEIYSPPARPDMQRAWYVTEQLLVAIRDEVKSHGAEFRIVTLATRPQVIPDSRKRKDLLRRIGVHDFSYADSRIDELGRREGIPVTNLAPSLADYAQTHQAYLNGFNQKNWGTGHWNAEGHRLAAEVIARDLCANGWLFAKHAAMGAE